MPECLSKLHPQFCVLGKDAPYRSWAVSFKTTPSAPYVVSPMNHIRCLRWFGLGLGPKEEEGQKLQVSASVTAEVNYPLGSHTEVSPFSLACTLTIQATLRAFVCVAAPRISTIPEFKWKIENSMSESAHLVLSLSPVPSSNTFQHHPPCNGADRPWDFIVAFHPYWQLPATQDPMLGREDNSRPLAMTLRFFWSV